MQAKNRRYEVCRIPLLRIDRSIINFPVQLSGDGRIDDNGVRELRLDCQQMTTAKERQKRRDQDNSTKLERSYVNEQGDVDEMPPCKSTREWEGKRDGSCKRLLIMGRIIICYRAIRGLSIIANTEQEYWAWLHKMP